MIEELIEILRRSRRSCSVAEVVSGGTDGSGPISCMAGWFYGKPGEPWPTNDRGIMIPLLQIDFAQVSNVPDCLQGISLLTMFLDRTRLPKHGYADSGDDWLLRAIGLLLLGPVIVNIVAYHVFVDDPMHLLNPMLVIIILCATYLLCDARGKFSGLLN